MTKVSVDAHACQGHARCWLVMPEVFELDDDGHAYALVETVPDKDADAVHEAAATCPERAIHVSD